MKHYVYPVVALCLLSLNPLYPEISSLNHAREMLDTLEYSIKNQLFSEHLAEAYILLQELTQYLETAPVCTQEVRELVQEKIACLEKLLSEKTKAPRLDTPPIAEQINLDAQYGDPRDLYLRNLILTGSLILSGQQLSAGSSTGTVELSGDVIGSSNATVVNTLCGASACAVVGAYENATSADTPDTLVLRDNNGSFAATTLTLTGCLIVNDTNNNSAGTVCGNTSALIIAPQGTRALQANSSGNARGQNAVDLQIVRGNTTQVASGQYAVIAGGSNNTASGTSSFIGSGFNNSITLAGNASVITGGMSNSVSNSYASVMGGVGNAASEIASFIGGGQSNNASNQYAVVVGGFYNNVSGAYGALLGGLQNAVAGNYSSVVGGWYNQNTTGDYSVIAGGYYNTASDNSTVIGGGQYNTASNPYAIVTGGYGNIASGALSVIVGGTSNTASNNYAIVVGGNSNSASGIGSIVVGGGCDGNASQADGLGNYAEGTLSFIGGGMLNVASGYGSVVVGGGGLGAFPGENNLYDGNVALGNFSFIGGGWFNENDGDYSVIGGGNANTVSNGYAALLGGFGNNASGVGSVVVGGGFDGFAQAGNSAAGTTSFVGGGLGNQNTRGDYAVIAGGANNTVTGYYASILGGYSNQANGDYSVALGQQAIATGTGSFVFADSQNSQFASTAHDTFNIRAQSGLVFQGNSTGSIIFTVPAGLAYGSSYGLILPTSAGSSGEVLTSNGANPAQLSWQPISAVVTSTIQLYGDVIGSTSATHVNTICGVPACNLVNTYSTLLSATPADIPNTLVLRDNTGSFAATTLTASSMSVDTQTLVVDPTDHLVGLGTATPALFAQQHVLEQKSRTLAGNTTNVEQIGVPVFPGYIEGGYLGVPYSARPSSLLIFDVTNPCAVNLISTFTTTVFSLSAFVQFVASGTHGYTVGTNGDPGSLTITSVDLSSISSPQLLNSYSSTTSNALIPRIALGTDRVYALDQETLYVFDTNLDLLGTQTVALPSGLINDAAINFAVNGTQVFIVTSNGLLSAYDVSNPGVNIPLLGSVQLGSSGTAIALSGSTAFVTTGPIIFVETFPVNYSTAPSLTSVNISNPSAMSVIATTSTHLTSPTAIQIIDTTAYLLDSYTSSIISFTISNPANMHYQTTFQDTATFFLGLASNKPYLYVTDYLDLGFLTLNVQPTYLLTVTQDLFVNGVVELAPTSACGGQYKIGGVPVLHTYRDDTFVGPNAGNFIYTSTFVPLQGNDSFFAPGNTGVGNRALYNLVNGFGNTGIGTLSLVGTQTIFYATGLGFFAQAFDNSTAVGASAQAANYYATALGANSQTTADNQIMLGDSTLVEVVPGGFGTTNLGNLNRPWNSVIGNGLQLTAPTFNYVTLQPYQSTSQYTLILPATYGTAGSVLTADGNNPAQLSWQTVSGTITSTIQLYGDVIGSSTATIVNTICGVPACNLVSSYSTVLSATSADIPLTLVLRDNTGSFLASTITVTTALNILDNNGDLAGIISAQPTGLIIAPQAGYALQASASGDARGQNAVDLQLLRSNSAHVASGAGAVIAGGTDNTASETDSFVGGGYGNTASNAYVSVVGGFQNSASGIFATVGGGTSNSASGALSFIGGGYYNQANGYYAVAMGNNAIAHNNGSFVFADSQNSSFTSAGNDTFNIRAQSGLVLQGNSTGSITFTVPSGFTSSYGLVLPNSTGASGQVLSSNGANPAQLSWQTLSAAITATSADTPLTLVLRDNTGSFAATTITLDGNPMINYYNVTTAVPFMSTPGIANTFLGQNAGLLINNTSSSNAAFGYGALMSYTGTIGCNTALGSTAMQNTTGGGSPDGYNVAVGYQALRVATTSYYGNVAIGSQALGSILSPGNNNTSVGTAALSGASGSNNTALGFSAGASITTGSNNICIGAAVVGVSSDNDVIRIGTQGTQTATYIAGIRGALIGAANPVYVNSQGQLGDTTSSSGRYKENIEHVGQWSENIYKLRPVVFNYIGDATKSFNIGLIAEEVADVYPELTVYKDNRIEGVRYHHLPMMMLNELQKEHARVTRLEDQLMALQAKIDQLTARE